MDISDIKYKIMFVQLKASTGNRNDNSRIIVIEGDVTRAA